MNRRVFIIHGWAGHPREGWFPWLKNALEAKGFDVFVPQLPEAQKPRIERWIPKVDQTVGVADKQTYFVGHSMGCQAIARYVESLPEGTNVGGAVFVAGFFKRLTGLEDDAEVQETDRHWLDAPLDFSKVKKHLPKSIAIFSDDDPFVPLDNQDDFRDLLGSEIIIEKGKQHFSGRRGGIFQLQSALEAVLRLASTGP